MNDFNDIKDLWQSARANDLPGAKEVVRSIKNYRAKQVIKNIAVIAMALFLVAVMVHVVFTYKSVMLTTRLGEACFFLALFILIGISIQALSRVPAKGDHSNGSFLHYLKQEQLKLISFYKRTQAFAFAVSAAGLGLYLFEGLKDANWLIAGYACFTVYVLACWFILRPLAFRAKTKKLREEIMKLEKLSGQLSEDQY
jgi:hypothetical protein